VAALLADPGIIRNRLKIASAIRNAKAYLQVQAEFGSFDAYLWRFVDGKPVVNAWQSMRELPASTPLSDALSKDLKGRGFNFHRQHDLLRLHAGGWAGERSCGGVLPVSGGRGSGNQGLGIRQLGKKGSGNQAIRRLGIR
jgi:hypothetical protein